MDALWYTFEWYAPSSLLELTPLKPVLSLASSILAGIELTESSSEGRILELMASDSLLPPGPHLRSYA